MEDAYLSVMENRKNRKKKIVKKNPLHGWLVCGQDGQYVKNKIYSSFIDNTYKEISFATKEKYNPYPKDWNVKYVGLVDEYLGEMTPKPNIFINLTDKIY